MLKTLVRLECKKILDYNVFRNSKHNKSIHCHSGMNLAAYIIVTVFFSLMIAGQTVGLTILGAGNLIPGVLILAGSGLTHLLSLFGIGQCLFSFSGLSMLRAMPVKSGTIALSRLLGRYVRSLLLVLALLLPGTILWGVLSGAEAGYYLIMVLGLPAVPLLPLALSALLGTGIMALSAGTRHPVGVQTLLTVLLMAAMLGISMLGSPIPDLTQDPEILAAQVLEQMPRITAVYPPAFWLGRAAVEGDLLCLAGFLGLSIGVFAAVAGILCRNFDRICRGLSRSRRGSAYQLGTLRSASPLKALYHRERRRYFASAIYVSNTIIGPVLAAAAAMSLLFLDLTPVEKILPVPVDVLLPLVWSMICCMMPPAAVSVTMEGKQIWQIKTLPVSTKTWLDSKILWSFSLMLPSYVVSQIVMTIARKPEPMALLWQLGMPLALMAFSCTFAVAADLRFHNFDFQKDETAVKQSISALVGGLGGALMSLLCGGVLILLTGSMLGRSLVFAVVAAAAAVCYLRSCRKNSENL